MPSVRFIAFIIDKYTKEVKINPGIKPISWIPKNPFRFWSIGRVALEYSNIKIKKVNTIYLLNGDISKKSS